MFDLTRNRNPKDKLPVMEHFFSIQGEGFHQGRAAYFIRLAGCDVGCSWCDVKESWDAGEHQLESIGNLVNAITSTKTEIAVITGGEPLMYDLAELTGAIQKAGIRTHLETSGAYNLSGNWDWICVSPKRFKLPGKEILLQADELKVIVFHKNDLRWAAQFLEKIKPECKLFLQPEWSKEIEMLPLIIEHVKNNPKWNISLQTHKYMNVP